ncbi:MAG TPA: glucose-6-phosphate isomerase, partial [Rhodothermales bacterium]
MIGLDASRAIRFIESPRLEESRSRAIDAHRTLLAGSGKGSDFLGWRQMLQSPDRSALERVQDVADEVRSEADVLICIGIGGSYLGAEAVIQALQPLHSGTAPEVYFLGHHL